jgi:hypothetical protein
MSDSGIKHFRRKLEQRRAERYKQNNDLDQKTTTFEFESQGIKHKPNNRF